MNLTFSPRSVGRGPRYRDIPTNGIAWFTDSSVKLNADRVHWVDHLLTETGHDISTQWVKLRAVVMAVQATPDITSCYIFMVSWAVANSLGVWSGEWQLSD